MSGANASGLDSERRLCDSKIVFGSSRVGGACECVGACGCWLAAS